jgi:outer membrane receptor protein involved in Fe transport
VWRQTTADSASKVNAYVIRNQLDLWSNFTYYMDDPVHGDQFAQPDRRVTSGVNALHTWHAHRGDTITADISAGLQAQNDNIFNGLLHTQARQTLDVTRQDHIVETSSAAWIESATRWGDSFRSIVGLRADRYRFRVHGDQQANSGSAGDTLLSPSLNLVFGPWKSSELYLNYGQGFHSNDARGAVTSVEPLVRSRGMEIGLRTEAIPRNQTALSLYRLDFDSELTYVGDAGTTEAGSPSRRIGIEFSNYYKPVKWLSIDFDAAFARARTQDAEPGQDRIPGAVEGVGQLAITASQLGKDGAWEGALRLRYFGPRPLLEDNSVRSHASTTLNGRIGYRIARDLRLELEGFNLANKRVSSIDYYYASQLRGEAVPHEDIHFHPLESRSFRLTLIKNF